MTVMRIKPFRDQCHFLQYEKTDTCLAFSFMSIRTMTSINLPAMILGVVYKNKSTLMPVFEDFKMAHLADMELQVLRNLSWTLQYRFRNY